MYEIDLPTQECDTCCVGIGEMIIDGDNDCTANIVGTCDELNLEE